MPQLAPAFATEPTGSEVYCVRFSPDDNFLAAATGHGAVCVYNVSTGQEAFRLNRTATRPVKQVCWRPEPEDAPLRTRGVFVGASTDGRLRQWHVSSNRCLEEFGDAEETGQLLCVDYSPDGTRIVAGGMQELWAFDEETKKLSACLKGGDSLTTSGHSSRVFAVRFHPLDSSLLVSAGWDSTVQFWDLRAGSTAVRAIVGPHVCGGALDISSDGSTLLTGSWRPEDQLELWDFGTGRRQQAIPWRPGGIADPPCLLYTACFSRDKDNSMILAGGSCSAMHEGEAKVFELGKAAMKDSPGRCIGTFTRFTCLSAHFSSEAAGMLACAGSDGRVRVMRTVPAAAEGGG
mmetsp:Transcript_113046/g.200401  ORF Transcript_113046/g.200401 Transcript_113046/m.200401 type:complete len:347 (-) Transcript_113046:87-1127(-)